MKLYNWFFLICILSFSGLQSNDLNKLKASLVLLKSKSASLNKGLADIGSVNTSKTLAELGIDVEGFKGIAFVNLNLSNKKLKNLPIDISNYNKITILNLSNNNLTKIDSKIGQLDKLSTLNLSDNKIKTFPDTLKLLSDLNLSSNEISDDVLKKLVGQFGDKLQTLNLSNNNITVIPDGLIAIKNLENLILKNNQLSMLPKEMSKLNELKAIDLSDNNFEKFPKELNVVQFNRIDLSNNKIKSVPAKLFTTNLNNITLDLTNNPLEIDDVEKLRNLTAKPGVEVLGLPDDPVMVEKKAFIAWLKGLKSVGTGGQEINLDNLSEFWELNLSRNNLTELHSGIKYAIKLHELYLAGNNIAELPIDVLKGLKELKLIVLTGNNSLKDKKIPGFTHNGSGRYTK